MKAFCYKNMSLKVVSSSLTIVVADWRRRSAYKNMSLKVVSSSLTIRWLPTGEGVLL